MNGLTNLMSRLNFKKNTTLRLENVFILCFVIDVISKYIMDKNFTLFCISNGSEFEYPGNTLTSFKNRLPLNLEIKKSEHSKWCVALESLYFSSTFGNIKWPNGPSFITVSLDYKDNYYRHYLLQNVGEECYSISVGHDQAHFRDYDNILREKLRLGKYVYGGEESDYKKYVPHAINWLMPDIHYFYPKDFYCNLDTLAKYFENMTKYTNFKIERTNNSIEIFSTTKDSDFRRWFLINTKLIYNSYFTLSIEFQNFDPIEEYRKTIIYYFIHDIKKIESQLIQIGSEYYKPFFMCDLIKKLTITIAKTEPEIHIPKIIKVRCENIKHQIFNSELSKDLSVFCPNLKNTEKLFHKEFQTKQFIPIENTTLNHLSFKLLDESNQPLKLVDGYATLLKLHFKKMPHNKNFFNVRISSKKTKSHPENSLTGFTVSLPNTLNFSKQWKVSVTSISHATVFNTFPPNSCIKFALKSGEIFSYKLGEKYTTIRDLVYNLEQLFGAQDYIRIAHHKPENRLVEVIRFSFYRDGVFILPTEVANVLGCSKNNFTNESGVAWNIVTKKSTQHKNNSRYFHMDFENTVDLLYYTPNYSIMYSNIVAPTILGGEFRNILKVFPVSAIDRKSEYQIQEFKHLEYHTLSNHEIKNITVAFRSHSGEKIFFGGQHDIIVNLLFTNYEE